MNLTHWFCSVFSLILVAEVAILTTDPQMSMIRILEVYALRWGIEVYFKEAKQHLGFLNRADVGIRLSYSVDSSHRDTLLNVGVCQAWEYRQGIEKTP